MSYVDRFLTYAPLTDTLDVCGGDKVPSYVRVENRHFPPHTRERFMVYVPEYRFEQLEEKLEEYGNYIQWLYRRLVLACSIDDEMKDCLPVPEETETIECVCDGVGCYGKRVTIHVMECPKCGRTYEHVNGDYERCPHCGTKFGTREDGQ